MGQTNAFDGFNFTHNNFRWILFSKISMNIYIRLPQIETKMWQYQLEIYVRRVFSWTDLRVAHVVFYLTFKTFLTAATISLVCGRAAASNDWAYGIGTSAPVHETITR